MHYAVRVAFRYLRSPKQSAVSVTAIVATIAVSLGVAALLVVMSITAGFQDAFQRKVLGVNAHVLVLKFGQDFEEYRDVIRRVKRMPEVAGAAPFVINEMMLAKGDRLQGVLVKGIDPELVATVLDLPEHIVQGSILGLRRSGSAPPLRPEDLQQDVPEDDDFDDFIDDLARQAPTQPSGDVPVLDEELDAGLGTVPLGQPAHHNAAWEEDAGVAQNAAGGDELPVIAVPTPEQAEQIMNEGRSPELPNEAMEEQLLRELALQREEGTTPGLPGIVCGVTLAESLHLGVGDRVQLIAPLAALGATFLSRGNAPQSRDFRVAGIFHAGFQEYDTRLCYVDLYEAQAFRGQGDAVMGVELRLHDLTRAPDIAKRIESVLGGVPFHTTDWQKLNENLFTALEIQKILLSILIASIIFVAAFCVIATLIMNVLEKKREIAILKAMGANDGAILTIFLVQGVIIGLVGTAVGLAVGAGVCGYLARYQYPLDPKVYLIDHLPVHASPMEFVVTVIVAMLISATATLVPSWWAARLPPADGVRYE